MCWLQTQNQRVSIPGLRGLVLRVWFGDCGLRTVYAGPLRAEDSAASSSLNQFNQCTLEQSTECEQETKRVCKWGNMSEWRCTLDVRLYSFFSYTQIRQKKTQEFIYVFNETKTSYKQIFIESNPSVSKLL